MGHVTSVPQGAVVVQSGGLPVPPRRRILPAKEMLSPAPPLLGDVQPGRDLEQSAELSPSLSSVHVTLVTGVEAYLVTPMVNVPNQLPHRWIFERVAARMSLRAISSEVELTLNPMSLAGGHDEVKRIGRIFARSIQ